MKKIIGSMKDKEHWISKLLSKFFFPILVAIIAGLGVYNFQVLFEKNKLQILYMEKTNEYTHQYFMKKQMLLDNNIQIEIETFQNYRQVLFDVINNFNDEDIVLDTYIKKIESINLNVNIKNLIHANMKQVVELTLLEDKVKTTIIFLEIFSNKKLDNYKTELLNLINLLNKLYGKLHNDIQMSIYQMTNIKYLMDKRVYKGKDFRELLKKLKFPSNTSNSLEEVQKKNHEIQKKLDSILLEMYQDLHNRLNGNIIEKTLYIFEDKARLYK